MTLVAVFALVIASPIARAQPSDDADARGRKLFDEGKTALDAGDLATACSSFEQSYIVSGVPGALLSWADCEERRERFATALALWKQGEAKVVGNEERRRYVRDRQTAILAKVSYIDLRLPAAPLEDLKVTLDGRAVDVTAGPVAVDAGEHTVVAEAKGRERSAETIRVAVGERATATLFQAAPGEPANKPEAPRPQPPPEAAASSDPSLPFFIAGGVTGGVGVASFIGFGVTGGLILSACGDLGDCPASERGSVDGLAVANAVTLGVGVAGVAVGVILFAVGATAEPEPAPVEVGGFGDAGLKMVLPF